MQGHLDIPLSDLGMEQAKKLARRLKDDSFDLVYSSDSARALVTAKTCFPYKQINIDKRLRERSYGLFEGKTQLEFNKKERAIYALYRLDPFENRLTGGENSHELFARIQDWLKILPEQGRVIVFSHGGVVRSLIREINGKDSTIDAIGNTSVNHFRLKNGELSLINYNDNSHL